MSADACDVAYESGRILVGSCVDRLADLADASVDSIVTDPPYELGFMGKRWDASGVAYDVELWRQCLRVLKPGGHLLAFGGTRTYHRMTVAIEDAGFEVRDSIHWMYGSGFPKSLDVSKAINKAAGAERDVVGTRTLSGTAASTNPATGTLDGSTGVGATKDVAITAPATDAAKQWDGWGTALKPAHEPIVLARKTLNGTVAANVLEHGTGALNIDGCRVAGEPWQPVAPNVGGRSGGVMGKAAAHPGGEPHAAGRWPANIVFTHAAGCDDVCAEGCPVAALDGQQDGASRFFTVTEWDVPAFLYVAKPSTQERNAGLDGMPKGQPVGGANKWTEQDRRKGSGVTQNATANTHPTVKPVALMRHLVRLVTPPGGIVLDPFLGSGTTAVAAVLEGFRWVGCEITADYLPIIDARVRHAETERHNQPPTLFDWSEDA